ncbi:Spliceosomal protein DIB1 [Astathelohania contejeani]|uniref:Spliceosomal protein DIB1 n=1 Tax=Astathelohania contejeani TaxID=164912 RepID=A0ABQ7I2M1_9MICR|nr:Spliceosomal protein DIB1 [Thelohania contejeani]
MLNNLSTEFDLQFTIKNEKNKLLAIRVGNPNHSSSLILDSLLLECLRPLSRYVSIYTYNKPFITDISDEPLNGIICFYNGKHIKIDCSTGNNNTIDFVLNDKKELIDLLTLAYKGGVKGKGLVVSPVKYYLNKK